MPVANHTVVGGSFLFHPFFPLIHPLALLNSTTSSEGPQPHMLLASPPLSRDLFPLDSPTLFIPPQFGASPSLNFSQDRMQFYWPPDDQRVCSHRSEPIPHHARRGFFPQISRKPDALTAPEVDAKTTGLLY